jgi:RNA polymerase sigma factor (sigma-70 family)
MMRVMSESLAQYSDRQLLERFTGTGDEAAFAAIVDRHGPMLLGLCRRLLSDPHLADDVLQATFLVLVRKSRSIRQRDNVAGWLYGVAQRLARQARLAEAARSRREHRVVNERSRASGTDANWHELLGALDEELQRMPERYRLPLLLCYLEGRTQDEAAKQLGLSLSTLRRRLEAGRTSLRVRMTRRGATLGAALFAGVLVPSAACATLTSELRQAVVKGAVAGGKGIAISASVWMLADSGMRLATTAKYCWGAVLAVLISSAVVGVVWQTRPATEAGQESVKAREGQPASRPSEAHLAPKEVARDLFNDPLPKGAIARAGTLAFRHGRIYWDGSLTFTADRKHLVSAGCGWVRRWDLATGHAVVNIGDGWRDGRAGSDLVTADGKLARICIDVPLPNNHIEQHCMEYDLEGGETRTYRLHFPRDRDAHTLPNILSPDGKIFAELNHQGTLSVWNADDGTVLHSFVPSGGKYTAVAFPPDGTTIVVGDDSHTIHFFDLATGKEQRSFGFFEGSVVARMAISPDGKWLVTAGGKKGKNPPVWPHEPFIRLWDLRKGTVVHTIEFPEDGGVYSLVFTRDSRTLIAATRGGTSGRPAAVRSWDVNSGKPGRAWLDDRTIGTIVAISPDGKVLATMNEAGIIRQWDMETGEEKRPLKASPCALEAAFFKPDGATILTIGEDLAIRQWDATTGRMLGEPRICLNTGYQPTFAAQGKLVMTCFAKDNHTTMVRLHDTSTGKLVGEQTGFAPVVSPDGRQFAVRNKDRRIRVFDVGTGRVIQTLTHPADEPSSAFVYPTPRAFTPDGRSLIVQGERVSVWEIRTGTVKSSWSLLKNKVLKDLTERQSSSMERTEAVAVSPDGSKIAFSLIKDPSGYGQPGGWFARVMLLETATGKLLQQADLDAEAFGQVVFSADGKLLAAGGTWTVCVWDVETWKKIGRFEGHQGQINSLAFSPDGKRLASASKDSTMLIWDVSR